MSRFPTQGHFVAWSGFCPGNNQSGGRRRGARVRAGDRTLKRAIMEAAHAGSRKKGSFLKARYHRLAGGEGRSAPRSRSVTAILKSVYHMLARGTRYADLGEDYYERRNPEQLARKLAHRIEKLGFVVKLEPLAQAV